ncbi:MAG TPA: glycosyltransferase family 2 protein [Nitrospirae bacterium]|nr:glycosyltransferase family 2 protein [Nitrospirota bacterium]
MAKRVSIIVITYNAGDDLKECLDSLEKQDYYEKEIVVVNDASTDGTQEFLQHFKNQTEVEMITVTNENNFGVAGARNVGIRHATGEIIAFTDSDCVADSKWVSELVRAYDHEGVAAAGGRILDDRVDNVWKRSSRGLNHVSVSEGYVSYIQGCNMSFKSEILRQYYFNDEIKYGYEETLLCDYMIADGHKIYYNPEAIVHHKHKADLRSLLRQKYLRGVSSVWYRQKQHKFFMLKRHLVLLIAVLLIPFAAISTVLLYLSLALMMVFFAGLFRDEVLFGRKNIFDILMTFPFLIFIELFHFAGACAGIVKFKILRQ